MTTSTATRRNVRDDSQAAQEGSPDVRITGTVENPTVEPVTDHGPAPEPELDVDTATGEPSPVQVRNALRQKLADAQHRAATARNRILENRDEQAALREKLVELRKQADELRAQAEDARIVVAQTRDALKA